MSYWSENFGDGNSFSESLANVFTPSDGAKYVGGDLVHDGGDSDGQKFTPGSVSNTGDTISGNMNSDSTNAAATAEITVGEAPSGLTSALGYVSGVGILGKIAGWANNIDPGKDTKTKLGNGSGGTRVTYTNADGFTYSYNMLGMPYEVTDVGGIAVDALSIKDPTTGLTGYEQKAQEARNRGDNDEADAILQAAADNAEEAEGAEVYSSDAILQMAQDAGMAGSNEQIQAILDDPQGWLRNNGALLAEKIPALDADTFGTSLDPNNPNYALNSTPVGQVVTGEAVTASGVENPGAVSFDAATTADSLGTDATTVDPATGEIRDENLVNAASIDMTGAATGTNEDGTTSVVGDALNDFATQNISNIIDTSTISGKLLAQKLGEGGYTDSKATILGQMEIISAEFKDSNGNPVIPPWAQSLARDVSKTMAFSGITGTAQTAAMSNAIMEATLGIAEREATFFQTLTTKNLDNRQEAIINRASVLAKFELANLDNRQQAVVQNAKAFLELDLQNLTNRQQAEVINTQSMVEALFNDQASINAARLFGAEQTNDMAKFYSNLNAEIDLHAKEQINLMTRTNMQEQNDGIEFRAKLEQSRQEFYSSMQYNIDLANAKWRQSVADTNNQNQFEAAAADVKNTMDISQEAQNQLWDRVDNMLDYIFKGWNAESDRDATILAAQMSAQANSKGGNGLLDGLFKLGAAWVTSTSDERLKTNIQYYDTLKGIKFYTWDWNAEGIRVGANQFPPFGVIAQQVQRTNPEAVVEGPDGYLMVNYGKLQDEV
jgi:hypothetical protein